MLTVHAPDAPVVVRGDGVLLARALDNLVDNAVAYNRPGGGVSVELQEDDDAVALVVSNDGPPVRPDEVEHLR